MRSVLVIVIVIMWAAMGGASADPPTAEAKQAAAEHFEAGRKAYNFGNYDVAIQEYQAAFDLTGAPEFVFNIAQTYRTKGDKQRALEAYARYVALDPHGAGVASAQEHIQALTTALRAEEAAAAQARKDALEAERRRQLEASDVKSAAAETARREAALAAQRRVADAEAARRRTTSRYLRISGLATGGTGLVTLGVSAVFGWRARTLSREASATTGMWTEEAQTTVDRANASQRTMYVLLGVGGALAITGGVLYVLGARHTDEPPRSDPKRISVTPAPIPGGLALSIGGGF